MSRFKEPVVLLMTVTTLLAVVPQAASAKVAGQNGRITFGRFNDSIGDFEIFTAASDGSDQVQLLPGAAECPRWSPDGTSVLVCAADPAGLIRPATVKPDGTDFTLLDTPDPTLNLGCWAWGAYGYRVACEGWDDIHPERAAGIFTVRASDGGGLTRVTTNPFGGHDIPGDYAPNGGRIVFARNNDPLQDPDNESAALFVVNTDGSGLRRITPWNFAEDWGTWSPDGRWIAFTNTKGKLFFVRPDGSGLHQVPIAIEAGRAYASQPAWAPDGTRLVLRAYLTVTGEVHLFTVKADGTDLQEVAGTVGNEEFPDWGPAAAA